MKERPEDERTETVEIDLSYEQYFTLNEEARKQEISLDDYINNILKEAMNDEKFISDLKNL